MSYYRGDGYYRGDSNYYRGDPFFGAIGGALAGVAGKLIGKAGKWVGGRLGGSAGKKIVRDAAIGAVAGGAAIPVLRSVAPPTQASGPPIQIGPLGISPGSAMPGGEPLFTWGRKKSRRMNPLNPKALKRALRRAEGFEKFAKKTVNALYKRVDGRRVKTFKRAKRRSS